MAHKEPMRYGNVVEEYFGYSQAVKAGDTIHVSGQTAFVEDEDLPEGMADQMRAAYANIADVLDFYGASLDDVVEEVVFVTDMEAAMAVANEVRHEVWGPHFEVASTLVQVVALAVPEVLVEIKVTARL
ncbi:MAG: Rid family hydrolase [Microthrixaceae bacterium]|nr:Rid family hydrolase [Microthrixaceae bacterium]